MARHQDTCHGRHCIFAMHVHLVFITKYRHRVSMEMLSRDFEGCSPDSLKGASSRMLRQERPSCDSCPSPIGRCARRSCGVKVGDAKAVGVGLTCRYITSRQEAIWATTANTIWLPCARIAIN